MTRIRSESERISSSSSETSRTARPSSRSSTSRRCTNSIAPTSSPRVGCAAMRTRGSRIDLAGDDDLLLVAAGERPRRRPRAAAAHVELLQELHGARDQPAGSSHPRRAFGGRSKSCNARFSARLNSSTRPRRCRSSGMCPTPASRIACVARTGQVRPGDLDAPARAAPQAGDRLDQLGLAVSVDARDAHDLAGLHRQRHAAHGFEPPVVERVQVLDLEQRLAGRARRLVDPQERPRAPPSAERGSAPSPPRRAASRSSSRAGAP